MKKLSLGKLKILSEEMLNRVELSQIYGGSTDNCVHTYKCGDGTNGSSGSGPCGTPGCSECKDKKGVVGCTMAGCTN